MGRSKPMRMAYYIRYVNPGKKIEMNCRDVTNEMKNSGDFYCMDCERPVVHAGGKNPHYRLPPKGAEHDENCDNYLPVDDISERIRIVGGKLEIELKVPSFHKKEEESKKEGGAKGGKGASSGNKPVKVGPIKTITDPNKANKITLNSAANLLYHTSYDRPQEHRMNVWRVLRSNKQYYYPKKYDELQNDFEKEIVNPVVFIRGRLHKNQFFAFKEHGYFDVQDHYKEYGPIELRVDLKGIPDLEKRFKNLTWYIRSGGSATEVIGIMGKITGVELVGDKTYIHIECYDLDVEPKDV